MNKIQMPQTLVRDVARFVNLLWIPVYPIFNECFIEPILKICSMDTKAYTQSPSSKLSRIDIDKLDHYGYIFLIVVTKSSLFVEKRKPEAKPSKKS